MCGLLARFYGWNSEVMGRMTIRQLQLYTDLIAPVHKFMSGEGPPRDPDQGKREAIQAAIKHGIEPPER